MKELKEFLRVNSISLVQVVADRAENEVLAKVASEVVLEKCVNGKEYLRWY